MKIGDSLFLASHDIYTTFVQNSQVLITVLRQQVVLRRRRVCQADRWRRARSAVLPHLCIRCNGQARLAAAQRHHNRVLNRLQTSIHLKLDPIHRTIPLLTKRGQKHHPIFRCPRHVSNVIPTSPLMKVISNRPFRQNRGNFKWWRRNSI